MAPHSGRVDLSPAVRQLLLEQRGLATLTQLRAHGMTAESVRWRLARGWRMVLPRVVLTGERLDRDRQLVAALLYSGPDAMITGAAAAAWHGVTAAAAPGPVVVAVPAGRRPSGDGFVVVRRTRRPDPQPWCRGPLVVASRARAVVEAARDPAMRPRARAIVIEAVQRRLVRLDDLRHELELGPRPGSAVVRTAIREAERGAWSVPEADLFGLVRGSQTLPEPWLNVRLTAADGTGLPIPDLWFDDVALAVQVHSRQYHEDNEDWEATVMSDGVFAEYGIPVVGVTPWAIRRRPALVLGRIERAHLVAAARPRSAVRAVNPLQVINQHQMVDQHR